MFLQMLCIVAVWGTVVVCDRLFPSQCVRRSSTAPGAVHCNECILFNAALRLLDCAVQNVNCN